MKVGNVSAVATGRAVDVPAAASGFRRRQHLIPAAPVAVAAYIALGLNEASLGVIWPSMRESLAQPIDALGVLLFVAAGGYLAVALPHRLLLQRLRIAPLLVASAAVGALGAGLYAAAPAWVVALTAAVCLGAAAAGFDATLNAYVAVHHSHRLLNLMHGAFGIGATLGPLGVTVLLGSGASWRWAYAFLLVYEVGLGVAMVTVRRRWRPTPVGGERDAGARPPDEVVGAVAATAGPVALRAVDEGTRPGSHPAVRLGLSLACFFLYVGVEASVGLWSFELLTGRGLAEGAAGVAITAYWGALTIGRLGLGAVGARVAPHRVLGVAAATALVGLAVLGLGSAASAAVGAVGLVATGLSLSGIFPALVAVSPHRLGVARSVAVMGWQTSAAAVGLAAVPAVVGVVAGRLGPAAIGPALLVVGVVFVAVHLLTVALVDRR